MKGKERKKERKEKGAKEKDRSNCVQIRVYFQGEQRLGAEKKGGMDIYVCVSIRSNHRTSSSADIGGVILRGRKVVRNAANEF